MKASRRRDLSLKSLSIRMLWSALAVTTIHCRSACAQDERSRFVPRATASQVTVADSMSGSAERIRSALRDNTELEFLETPLQDAVDFIHDAHGIEVHLDKRALKESGIDETVAVTNSFRGVTLNSALKLLLDELGLVAVIHHEVLLITTPKAAERTIVVRAYDVSNLTSQGVARESIVDAIVVGLAPAAADGSLLRATERRCSVLPVKDTLIIRDNLLGHKNITDLLATLRRHVKEAPAAQAK